MTKAHTQNISIGHKQSLCQIVAFLIPHYKTEILDTSQVINNLYVIKVGTSNVYPFKGIDPTKL